MRNYVSFWFGVVELVTTVDTDPPFTTYFDDFVIAETQSEFDQEVNDLLSNLPPDTSGALVFSGIRYFELDKLSVIFLLSVAIGYLQYLPWFTETSPRETWSHGH